LARPRTFPSSIIGTVSPQQEASGLWRLIRRRCFTIDEIRELIRVSPSEAKELRETFGKVVAARAVAYRWAVRMHFDALAGRGSNEEKKENRAA
jgi:hypothetical protein